MNPAQPSEHLSEIETDWALLHLAHTATGQARRRAQAEVLDRYRPAVYRYLLAGLRDADAAEDLYQEFALRFIRGDFQHADPQRNRFPEYLRTVLSHLITHHQLGLRRQPIPLTAPAPALVASAREAADLDADLVTDRRDALLAHTWAALAESDRRTGHPLFVVLLCHVRYPDEHSPQLSQRITMELGRHVSPAWVRKWLPRARAKFAGLLVEEVVHTLRNPTADTVVLELRDLGVLNYCRPTLDSRRGATRIERLLSRTAPGAAVLPNLSEAE
jgi:RNA polymerase sigma-70 factor (ECF subfamily)